MSYAEHLWSLCLAGVHPVTPGGLWHAWSLAPSVLVPLAALLVLGLRGHTVMGGADRATVPADVRRRRTCFLAGWLLLAISLVSPLCRLSATLVSAHMVQLMLLVGPATLLLAIGRIGPALAAALPTRSRKVGQPAARHAGRLGITTAAYGLAIWLWHVPAAYDAILTDPIWHWLAFAALIAVSIRFWAGVVDSRPTQVGSSVAALLTTLIHTGLLGALLTFAARPFYAVLADGAAAWGLTPLQDQQLAGLVMWVGGGVFYLLAALVLCAVWLRAVSSADAAAGRL
jgi:putative membrane protein